MSYASGTSRICLQGRCSYFRSFRVPPDRRMKETLLVAVGLPRSLHLSFEGGILLETAVTWDSEVFLGSIFFFV